MKKVILFLCLFALVSCGDSFTDSHLVIKKVIPSDRTGYLYYYEMYGVWQNEMGIYSNDTFYINDRVKLVKDTTHRVQ